MAAAGSPTPAVGEYDNWIWACGLRIGIVNVKLEFALLSGLVGQSLVDLEWEWEWIAIL